MITRRALVSLLPAGLLAAGTTAGARGADASLSELSGIAEEAYIYGFPMVMNYATLYASAIDKASSQYKAPFNQLFNEARVFTPKDTTVVSPNCDTAYSVFAMDLRAEPVVFCHPEIAKARYFSVRLVDMRTGNFGYIGSRTTGNGPGCFMIAGPGWSGDTPHPMTKVFRCETAFALGLVRTQLFNPADVDNVKKIQSNYRADPLSKFWAVAPPPAPPEVAWPAIEEPFAEADLFAYLNFVLQFCPPLEASMRTRFARIGIAAGRPFPATSLTPDQHAAIEDGAQRSLHRIKRAAEALGNDENGWLVATDAFGDPETIGGEWTRRAAAAMTGISDNDAAEAICPLLETDSEGEKPDGRRHRYTLTFAPGEMPPVNALWSVTIYDARRLLVANAIDRYLINASMLPGLRRNANGSITLYIQKDSPGSEHESNWLPAPDGPINLVMRLYRPKEAALEGRWKPPPLLRVA